MAPEPIPLYLYRVLMPDGSGVRDLLCVVPLETGFTRGLPSEAIVGTLLNPPPDQVGLEGEPGELSPENFAQNAAFRVLYHDVVRRFAPDEPGFAEEARRIGNGYVYIIDQRTPDPGGEVPGEDIVGGFKVHEGALVRDGYVPNPEFRFVGKNGLFTLSDSLLQRLLEEIARRNADA